MITTILAFIFVFAIIVLVHEGGHYLLARKFGVKVNEFAFGFPPRLWSKKKGDTVYAVNAIPLGGYVRLHGEDGSKDDDPTNLNNKKPWQKGIIFAAGVLMNFVLAWVLLTGFYLFGGQAIIDGMWDYKGVENTQRVLITEVEEESPAAEAGVKSGDKILAINSVDTFNNNAVFYQIQLAKESDLPINVVLETDESTKELEILTYTDQIKVDGEMIEVERIGVTMETIGSIKSRWYLAPIVAAQELVRLTKMTVVGIYDFFRTLILTLSISENVGGPVAIAQITGVAAKLGFSALIQTIIILSIVLGVFNILPFPALDGGHILFLGIEKLIRREVPSQVKNLVNLIGFGLLLLLVIAVTFKDIGRLNIF